MPGADATPAIHVLLRDETWTYSSYTQQSVQISHADGETQQDAHLD